MSISFYQEVSRSKFPCLPGFCAVSTAATATTTTMMDEKMSRRSPTQRDAANTKNDACVCSS